MTIINIISVLVSAVFLIKASDEAYEAKNTEIILETLTSEVSL